MHPESQRDLTNHQKRNGLVPRNRRPARRRLARGSRQQRGRCVLAREDGDGDGSCDGRERRGVWRDGAIEASAVRLRYGAAAAADVEEKGRAARRRRGCGGGEGQSGEEVGRGGQEWRRRRGRREASWGTVRPRA